MSDPKERVPASDDVVDIEWDDALEEVTSRPPDGAHDSTTKPDATTKPPQPRPAEAGSLDALSDEGEETATTSSTAPDALGADRQTDATLVYPEDAVPELIRSLVDGGEAATRHDVALPSRLELDDVGDSERPMARPTLPEAAGGRPVLDTVIDRHRGRVPRPALRPTPPAARATRPQPFPPPDERGSAPTRPAEAPAASDAQPRLDSQPRLDAPPPAEASAPMDGSEALDDPTSRPTPDYAELQAAVAAATASGYAEEAARPAPPKPDPATPRGPTSPALRGKGPSRQEAAPPASVKAGRPALRGFPTARAMPTPPIPTTPGAPPPAIPGPGPHEGAKTGPAKPTAPQASPSAQAPRLAWPPRQPIAPTARPEALGEGSPGAPPSSAFDEARTARHRSKAPPAKAAEHGAQGTEHGAKAAEHGAKAAEHGAQGNEHGAEAADPELSIEQVAHEQQGFDVDLAWAEEGRRETSTSRPPPTSASKSQSGSTPRSTSQPTSTPPMTEPHALVDRGALVARRTMVERDKHAEALPQSVGEGPAALRFRTRLLESLASVSKGAVKSRLLSASGELHAKADRPDTARERYREALHADREDVVALRALRRDARERGALPELADLLEHEARLDLSPTERGMAWMQLSEVRMQRGAGAQPAEEAAAHALSAHPTSMVAALHAADLKERAGLPGSTQARRRSAENWKDAEAAAGLWVEIGRAEERESHTAEAFAAYRRAAELDAGALDALLGMARVALLPGGDPEEAVAALQRLAGCMPPPMREVVLTRACRTATLAAQHPRLGLSALPEAQSALARQATAEAAMALPDREAQTQHLAAWAEAADGTDRALALVRLAEVHAALEAFDEAEASLREAALADGALGTIPVVRRLILRRAGQLSRLSQGEKQSDRLEQAARAAAQPDAQRAEQQRLAEASAEEGPSVTADVVGLDVAAELGDREAIWQAIDRLAERARKDARPGPLLAGADLALAHDELERARTLLERARRTAPGRPTVLRAAGRIADDPAATAALWLLEAAHAEGDASAFAATQAARMLAAIAPAQLEPSTPDDIKDALGKALESAPGYGPAGWALFRHLQSHPDTILSERVALQFAERAPSPELSVRYRARAIALKMESDLEGAGVQLLRALDEAPDDGVLLGFAASLRRQLPAHRSAVLFESASRSGRSADGRRVLALTAASAYEDAGNPGQAAAQLRAVAQRHRSDPMVGLHLDRLEVAAGDRERVAARRKRAVKAAQDGDERVLALERLAWFERYEQGDPAAAAQALSAIFAIAPTHRPTLRELERYYTEHGPQVDLRAVVARLTAQLEDPEDISAHLRLATRLHLATADAGGDGADEILVAEGARAAPTLWLVRRVLGAATSAGNAGLAYRSAQALVSLLATPVEKSVFWLRCAELSSDMAQAAEDCRRAVQAHPSHPLAAERRARLLEELARWDEASAAWEQAAQACAHHERAALRFYRAGRLRQERCEDRAGAIAFYQRGAELDANCEDLFERLRGLLEEDGAHRELATLYEHRIAAGAEPREIVDLYNRKAEHLSAAGDGVAAKGALRSALVVMPEHAETVRALAQHCLAEEDWRGAAESLIRYARLRKDQRELLWVFLTLGQIYDRHMPDPRRAKAAYQRVLKLDPEHVDAMVHLAELYRREGQHREAVSTLSRLVEAQTEQAQRRQHHLDLAASYEALGESRNAEEVLDRARRATPTDLTILRRMADLYERQSADNALAMHLRRASYDFRQAIENDPSRPSAWAGLVETLSWRRQSDSASAVASAASALGIVDLLSSKLLDERGAAPPLGSAAADDGLDDLLAPAALTPAARAVFREAADALEKASPFDVRAYQGERLKRRDQTLRPSANQIAEAFGLPEPDIYVTSAAPRVCVPVSSAPLTLLIGSELLHLTDPVEQAFILYRALKIAKARWSLAARSQPQEFMAAIGGLFAAFDVPHPLPGIDAAAAKERAKRFVRYLPKKQHPKLAPLVLEMAGVHGFDPSALAADAANWGNRVGLLATGSAPAALSALVKLSGERALPASTQDRIHMLSRFSEASSLLTFAVSDDHFEARSRKGTQR